MGTEELGLISIKKFMVYIKPLPNCYSCDNHRMTRTRSRSPSPDTVAKRLKTAHKSTREPSADPTPHFSNDLFDHNNIARLHSDYLANTPFKYAVVEKLFQDELLKSVKDECLAELNFTEKETDIYKVQSLTVEKPGACPYINRMPTPPSHVSRSTKQATLPRSIFSLRNRYPNSHRSSRCGMPYTRLNSATFYVPLLDVVRSRARNKTCRSTLTLADVISSTTTT